MSVLTTKGWWISILATGALALFVGSGCDSGKGAIGSDLNGRWQWIESRAVALPRTVTPETVGTHFEVEFSTGEEYHEYVNGQRIISGQYSLSEGEVFSAPDTLFPVIRLDTTVFFDSLFWEATGQAIRHLSADSLVTEGTDSDSYTHIFRRVQTNEPGAIESQIGGS